MKSISEFYNIFPCYEVPYQGEVFTINDRELGDIGRFKDSSEASITHHIADLPIHLVRGIIGDMVRYYSQLVQEQTEQVQKAEAAVYRRLKPYTFNQIYPNSQRASSESSKPPTDKMISSFLLDDLSTPNPFLEPREDIAHYQLCRSELNGLTELLEKLKNSFQIVSDAFKVVISLNANERERDKAHNYVNGMNGL